MSNDIVGTPTKLMSDDISLRDNRADMKSAWDKDAPEPGEIAVRAERPPIDAVLSQCRNPAEAVEKLQAAGYTHSEVKTFVESIDDTTFDDMLKQDGPEPAWLASFEPDTQLSHAGWECRILTSQPVADGRTLVLIEPLCTTPEARAKYRTQLKRRGFAEKKVQKMLKEAFPGEAS